MKKIMAITVTLSLMVFCFGTVWAAPPETPPSVNVTVVNPQANPVPVTGTVEVTKRSTIPVRLFASPGVDVGQTFFRLANFYTIPAGKRLIVEHLSCALFLYPPDSLGCAIEDGFSALYISPASTLPDSITPMVVSTGQAIKVIFEAGESFNLIARWVQPNPGMPGIFFGLSGYLEDAQ